MIEEPPDTERLYAPLRELPAGVCLRLFRDRGGERCAVAFTSLERLTSLLGPEQRYYRLTERAVRDLAADRGVSALIVDPGLVAPPVREHVLTGRGIEREAAPVPAAVQTPSQASAAAIPTAATSASTVGTAAVGATTTRVATTDVTATANATTVKRTFWAAPAAGIVALSAASGVAALLWQAF